MADEEHVAILRQGRDAWNRWRLENPLIVPDLSDCQLMERNFSRINFYKADLTGLQAAGVNLENALLRDAQLSNSDLSESVLRNAVLSNANLTSSNLAEANLSRARADGVNFSGADLIGANFDDAILDRANFSDCTFGLPNLPFLLGFVEKYVDRGLPFLEYYETDEPVPTSFRNAKLVNSRFTGGHFDRNYSDPEIISRSDEDYNLYREAIQANGIPDRPSTIYIGITFEGADLTGANLEDANFFANDPFFQSVDFRRTTLIGSCLDGSDISGARLWEAQRDGWSVRKIRCSSASWDREGLRQEEYEEGRFERAFANRHEILLEYPDGMRAVDLALLPLVIDEIGKSYGRCDVSMKSAVDAGSRSVVVLSVLDRQGEEDSDFKKEFEQIRGKLTDAHRALSLEIESRKQAEMLLRYHEEKILPMLMETIMRSKTVTIGHVGGDYVDAEGASYVEAGRGSHRSSVSITALSELLRQIDLNSAKINSEIPAAAQSEFSGAVKTLRGQLGATTPDQNALAGALASLRRIAESASGSVLATAIKSALGI